MAKADLQSLNLTARVFPPLVRRRPFRRLIIDLGCISEDDEPLVTNERKEAIALHEMYRLLSFQSRLAALVREVWFCNSPKLEAPPWSIRMTAHDLVQLVYAIFPRLEEVVSLWRSPSLLPPHLPLSCCQTLHTILGLNFDAGTWNSLQKCSGLRNLGIDEIDFGRGGRFPVVPPSLPFRLETLIIRMICGNDTGHVFLTPFLRACGPTLKYLYLISYDDVWNLSMLPKLASLTVRMRSGQTDETPEEAAETLVAWLAAVLPTCHALEHLGFDTTYRVHQPHRTPASLLAVPELAAVLPATLKRIDFDMSPRKGELEAALSKNNSVQVIGMPTQQGDSPWLEFCRQRGITVVDSDMDAWSA